MTLKKNILANYVGTGVVALAPILTLPWYLSSLGPARWGLISFVATLQAVLGLLDAGMSQALVREIAIRLDSSENGRQRAALLLLGFERIYWLFAFVSALITAFFADKLATGWLKLGNLPIEQGRIAVYGAAAIFCAQLPGSIYRSLLVAAQAQVALNVIMTCSAIVRYAGGVLIVMLWPNILAYLTWHAAVMLAETVLRAAKSWNTLRIRRSQVLWDLAEIRKVIALALGLSGAILPGALAVQMDKIVLSRMVPIELFGYYAIASSLALGALQLVYPVVQAILPRAVLLRNDAPALRRFNFRYAGMILLLIAIGAVLFSVAGRDLIVLWIRDAVGAAEVYLTLRVLLVGTALNALYTVGYINWIVNGCVRKILQVNLLSLIIGIILIPIMVERFGTIGAAIGWLTINSVGLILSLDWLKSSPQTVAR